MPDRVHLLLDAAEKERFRRWAERTGKTLSEWLREAAREKLAAESEGRELDSREALESFFAGCDARAHGEEPDWESHRRVIEQSIRSGGGAP